MFTRKVSGPSPLAVQWFAVALILGYGAVANAQSGGMGGMGGAPSNEQRLFPNGLPKIEAMLKAALEHHPDVLVARSKLRAAEAEQRQAEFKALKEILDVRDRWEKANRKAVDGAENPAAMRDRLAVLAAVEWEISFLIGTRGEPAIGAQATGAMEGTPSKPVAERLPASVMVESAIPHGDKAKVIKNQLGSEIMLPAQEIPLTEVVKLLSKETGLRFLLDKEKLEEDDCPIDSPINIDLGKLEVGEVLQVLEDLHRPLCFIVRDYGVLVTSESVRSSKNVSVIDFWKLSEEELRDKLRHQLEEEAHDAGRGMDHGGGWF